MTDAPPSKPPPSPSKPPPPAPFRLWTDGACSGNPGPGGWGVVIIRPDGGQDEVSGSDANTTNNRMELLAAIKGLELLGDTPQRVTITTDSEYVKKGMEEWSAKWIANGWRSANRQPVKNQDLWRAALAATKQHEVSWRWVRGHTGDPMNERADLLARMASDRAKTHAKAHHQ